MNERMLTELNKQINEEMFSAYLYFAMSAYFEDISLPGFASWMRVQAQEEMFHASKFYHYIVERGDRVELEAIAKPDKEWASPKAAFEATLTHEKHITSRINHLMSVANEENDYATANMLQWFIAEQVEEESAASDLLGKLTLIGDAAQGLFMIDAELGKRVFTPPAAPAE